nr:MAG TPA: hypothetical protein [Caudoviricetes sp.]
MVLLSIEKMSFLCYNESTMVKAEILKKGEKIIQSNLEILKRLENK